MEEHKGFYVAVVMVVFIIAAAISTPIFLVQQARTERQNDCIERGLQYKAVENQPQRRECVR